MEIAKELIPFDEVAQPQGLGLIEKLKRLIGFHPPAIVSKPYDTVLSLSDEEVEQDVLRKDIKKCLAEEMCIDISKMTPRLLDRIYQDVKIIFAKDERAKLTTILQNNQTVLGYSEMIRSIDDAEYDDICQRRRENCIGQIDKDYHNVVNQWAENPSALSDEWMGGYFKRNDHKMAKDRNGNNFLTTYFDAAQFGLINTLLDEAAERISAAKPMDFIKYMKDYLNGVIGSFDCGGLNKFGHVDENMGLPKDIIFIADEAKAFKLFSDKFIQKDDKVLVSYEGHTKMLDDFDKNRVAPLPECKDFDSYEECVRSNLERDKQIKYILVGDINHTENQFPIDRLYEICKQYGVKLIANGNMVLPNNIVFSEGGAKAFKLFSDKFIQKDDKVLVTSEEYTEMLDDLGKEKIVTLPEYKDFDSYEECVRNNLEQDKQIKYMLVSDISRRGNKFPIDRLYEICKQYGVKLIADVCQSTGVRPHDFRADVIISSIHKGAELGQPSLGFFIVSDELIDQMDDPKKIADLAKLRGTVSTLPVARAFVACNPHILGTLDKNMLPDEILRKMTISPKEREEIVNDLGCKFAELVQAINAKRGNRKIEFFNQHLVYEGGDDKKGNVNKEHVTPIFECRIQGVNRETVQKVSEAYGVVINNYFDPWAGDASFRVRFHPFMSNDSIKILGRVLEICSNPGLLRKFLEEHDNR